MKWLFVGFLFLLNTLKVNAQSLNLNDLINLVSMSHEQAKAYLTHEKHFVALPIIDKQGTTIAQFSKNDVHGITELVVKSAWQDKRVTHPFLHYDVRPKSCANIIVDQLKRAAFRLISQENDAGKKVLLFDNDRFMISIYTFTEKKLPASIEIHVK
jgi:hypothetical protein